MILEKENSLLICGIMKQKMHCAKSHMKRRGMNTLFAYSVSDPWMSELQLCCAIAVVSSSH